MPKLREYKGVVYKEDSWYCHDDDGASTPNVFVALGKFINNPTDEDHEALMDLKQTPYELTPTLEDVVEKWNESAWVRRGESDYALKELCEFLREAFPQIDTATDEHVQQIQSHIDALVDMGAKYYSGDHPFMEGYPRLVLPKVK